MAMLNSIQSVLSIAIMVTLGYILAHKGWLNETSSDIFSKIVLNISLPTLMISNLMTNFNKEKLESSVHGLIIPFLSMAICYFISILICNFFKIDPKRRGIFQSMFFVSNTIFIGLPVNISLFGDKSIPYVLLYYIANTTLFWTVGVYGISKDGGNNKFNIFSITTIKRIFSPALMGFIIAIIFILLNIHLPIFIMDSFKYLGNLTTPLSMLFIGTTIYSVDMRALKFNKDMFLLLLGRFIISPLIVFFLAKLIPIPSLMEKVFIIQSAMPVMTSTAIIAKGYNADYEYGAIMAAVTTIASLLSIPIYMQLFALIAIN